MFPWKLSTIVVAGLAISLSFISYNLDDANMDIQVVTCDAFPSICKDPISNIPDTLAEKLVFGRFRNPTTEIKFSPAVYGENQFFKLKRWHYMAVNFEKYFFAAAMVQFNYVADVFVYVIDKNNKNEKIEYHIQRPLGFGVHFAPSSVKGCSSVTKSLVSAETDLKICFNPQGYWEINANLFGNSDVDGSAKPIVANIRVEKVVNDALAFTFPLGASVLRPAYVHKGAGMKAKGYLTIGGDNEVHQNAEILNGSSGIDWTYALALHHTQWKWVSFNSMETMTHIYKNKHIQHRKSYVGINLSDKVYDVRTKSGDRCSVENAIWIDSHVIAFRYPIEISMPERGELKGSWAIRSTNPTAEESVDLHFVPISAREDHLDLSFFGLVSDFVQPYGYFNGTITISDNDQGTKYTLFFEDVFGVVENHNALW